jgi:hypothetical protein
MTRKNFAWLAVCRPANFAGARRSAASALSLVCRDSPAITNHNRRSGCKV